MSSSASKNLIMLFFLSPERLTVFKGNHSISVDKKFLAEIYEQENLMNDLFPNTVSCTNISKIEPCKKCYWCEEKKWAFGMYDGCLT